MRAYLKHFAHNQRLGYLIFIISVALIYIALLYAFHPLGLTPATQIQCGPGLAYLNGVCVAP